MFSFEKNPTYIEHLVSFYGLIPDSYKFETIGEMSESHEQLQLLYIYRENSWSYQLAILVYNNKAEFKYFFKLYFILFNPSAYC